ncbi:MAG: D-glucuronyl C5-epimerase family protein [Gemmatirosa sp.]
MPRKEWTLLFRDLSFYLTGSADVSAGDWHAQEWAYPADWSYQLEREDEYFAPKDADGIPLRDFPAPIGPRYLPSRIASYALGHWNAWLRTRSSRNRLEFVRAADWFLHASRDGRYEHDIPVAGKTEPWLSCIAQGEAASVLARAYHLTGDTSYLSGARAAVYWLLAAEESGGLRSRLPDGGPFLEEYPGTIYRHVLNGCLYAAIGIHDLVRADPEATEARTFLAALIDSIGRNVHVWDVRGWSTYDYPFAQGSARNLNTMTYQVLQAVLLRYLGEISGDTRLSEVADRWDAATRRLTRRLGALRGKLAYRLAARW